MTECLPVIIVDPAVAFQSKMYVSETSSSFKKCHIVSLLFFIRLCNC
jgi:hypothetical protein